MTVVERYVAGDFCWAELETTNLSVAKRFYGRLFGWTFRDESDDEPYTLALVGDRPVAGVRLLSPAQPSTPTPGGTSTRSPSSHWRSHVAVPSIEQAAAEAARLGATTLVPPTRTARGARCILSDPVGAAISLWEPGAVRGAGRMNEPGTMCWNELATSEVESACAFYARMFQWTPVVGKVGARDYVQFLLGRMRVAGLVGLQSRDRKASQWLVYFAVANCESAVGVVEGTSGRVSVPPTDIAGVGRFGAVRDPLGAVFAIIQLGTG